VDGPIFLPVERRGIVAFAICGGRDFFLWGGFCRAISKEGGQYWGEGGSRGTVFPERVVFGGGNLAVCGHSVGKERKAQPVAIGEGGVCWRAVSGSSSWKKKETRAQKEPVAAWAIAQSPAKKGRGGEVITSEYRGGGRCYGRSRVVRRL